MDLVTGGAGFIGSHVTERLLSEGRDVRVLDDFSTGRRENFHFPLGPGAGRLEVVSGDIADPGLARRAVEGVEHVFHQAAIPSVPRSVADPLASHHANATGTLNMLIAARDAGVKRFIYASSSSVYGDSERLPKVETMPAAPLSPYAVSKLACELYAKAFHRLYGLATIGLRYFNVFGPRQDPASQYAAVVPKFITAIRDGRAPTIFGDGRQTRDFTYVGNAVDANMKARDCGPAAHGRSFNIACGASISLLELVDRINGIFGSRLAPVHEPSRPGDVKHSLADVSEAVGLLGYRPGVSLEEGLALTAAWYRKA